MQIQSATGQLQAPRPHPAVVRRTGPSPVAQARPETAYEPQHRPTRIGRGREQEGIFTYQQLARVNLGPQPERRVDEYI